MTADHAAAPEVERLIAVMHRLRQECPWDAQQTHRSLVQYLVEESLEVVEAIEAGDDTDLREELGDLLLQVVFHSELAGERTGGFGINEVAAGIADKLIRRHPYVFASEQTPQDLLGSWEQRKKAEKGRTSALEGIPEQMSALARANKVIARSRSHQIQLDLPTVPIAADTLGSELLALAARAQASGLDPEQAMRDAVRGLEADIRDLESSARS